MAGTTGWTVARKKASTWGTAVAVGAGNGVKIKSETLSSGIPDPIKDDAVGDPLSGGTYQGNETCEGNVVIPMRYEGIEYDLAQIMGEGGTPATVEATVAFLHTMAFQASNLGIFATWAMDKGIGALGSAVHEYESCKYGSLEVGHEEGAAQATFGMIANHCERASTVNGNTEMAAVTNPTDGLLMLFSQMTVRLLKITGSEGNLDSSHNQLVTDARLSTNRNIAGDQVAGNEGQIDEPDTNGMPEAQLVLSFAQYTSALDALLVEAATVQAGRAPNVYKAQVFWTGPEIPGTAAANTYFCYLEFPALTIAPSTSNAPGPGSKVPVELALDISTPQTTTLPDGSDWSWATAGDEPLRARVQNGNSADPLA